MTIFETVRNEKVTSIQLNVNEKIFQNSYFPKNNSSFYTKTRLISSNEIKVN